MDTRPLWGGASVEVPKVIGYTLFYSCHCTENNPEHTYVYWFLVSFSHWTLSSNTKTATTTSINGMFSVSGSTLKASHVLSYSAFHFGKLYSQCQEEWSAHLGFNKNFLEQ